jgi:fatty-acyl-CoA synthase
MQGGLGDSDDCSDVTSRTRRWRRVFWPGRGVLSVTETRDYKGETFAEALLAHKDNENLALLFADESWSWSAFIDECGRRASLWQLMRDPKAPPHIGVLLDNVPDYLFWLGAGALAGATIVGINSTYRGSELARLINHTDCQVLVTEDRYRPLMDGLDLDLQASHVLQIDGQPFRDALRDVSPTLTSETIDAQTLQLLIFTSGSTAAPKAVRCTQGRMRRTGTHVAAIANLSEDDIVYPPLPLFHSSALFTGWSSAVHVGATMAIRRKFSASAFLSDVRRWGVTFVPYTGKVLQYIMATKEADDDADNTMRLAVGNEASLADIEGFARRFDCEVRDSYGSTEGLIIIRRSSDMPALALGKGGEGVRVFDPDTGIETEDAEIGAGGRLVNEDRAVGELVQIDPGQSFEGYYRNPEADRTRFRDGIFWSGDLAYRDASGWIYFVGRDNDWIRVDGENFASRSVESIVVQCGIVRASAAYAVPDSAVGDRVMVAVELREGYTFDPADLDLFLDNHPDLSPKWRPSFVRVVDALPVLASLKVDKRTLRREAWECADPVWWRNSREGRLTLLDTDTAAAMNSLLHRPDPSTASQGQWELP